MLISIFMLLLVETELILTDDIWMKSVTNSTLLMDFFTFDPFFLTQTDSAIIKIVA